MRTPPSCADGVPNEVEDVEAVVSTFHDLILNLFAYYASLGSSDVSAMGLNEWSEFVSDFKLADKRSKFLKSSDLDRLFIAVDTQAALYAKRAESAAKARRSGLAQLKSIGRVEFVIALVHIAILRYVSTGFLSDVSEAVHKLLADDLQPLADPAVFVHSDAFRRNYAYLAQTTRVLHSHESSLRATFAAILDAGGPALASRGLLPLETWLDFLRGAELMGADLTQRDATFAFVFSRMVVVDGNSERGRVKETCLPFEGFLVRAAASCAGCRLCHRAAASAVAPGLCHRSAPPLPVHSVCAPLLLLQEALCRISVLKSLPTDEEVEAAGCTDAGAFFKLLRSEDEARYERMLHERSVAWGGEPSQPIWQCVAHVLAILFREVEEDSAGKDNLVVTQREAESWAKSVGICER